MPRNVLVLEVVQLLRVIEPMGGLIVSKLGQIIFTSFVIGKLLLELYVDDARVSQHLVEAMEST